MEGVLILYGDQELMAAWDRSKVGEVGRCGVQVVSVTEFQKTLTLWRVLTLCCSQGTPYA